MTVCLGCNVDYKVKGYTLHLQKSGWKNPACRAIFELANASGLGPEWQPARPDVSEAHNAEFGDAASHGLPNGAFEGDFFGGAAEYAQEGFGYVDSDSEDGDAGDYGDDGDDGDEEEDDVSAQDAADIAKGYEPERRQPLELDDDAVMEDANTLPKTAAPSRATRKAAEDRFHHKPITEMYPGTLAGKPISAVRMKTAEEEYRTLIDSTAENPYAPFKSKMDWEVAKWAKLRGSGSTAFTDLLNVEGVCKPDSERCID